MLRSARSPKSHPLRSLELTRRSFRRFAEPWVLLLLKLASWGDRRADSEKDLFDCRLLLEASAHDRGLGLTLDELHHHWEQSLSDAGRGKLGKARFKIENRMEIPRLIKHMNQWEQPFIRDRDGGFGDHAYNPDAAKAAGKVRWQKFFNVMDQILQVSRAAFSLLFPLPSEHKFAFSRRPVPFSPVVAAPC